MTKMEFVQALRARTDVHYNCCQAVTMTFAEECGLTQEQAQGLGAQFGAGMKMGATCGAITGGLMVLGMMGASDEASRTFLQHFRQSHGATNCADLLKLDREKGNTDKKAHCDGLIYEAVQLVEELTR